MSERGSGGPRDGGGPYREMATNPETESLERMRKQIEEEGKHGILVPDKIGDNTEIPKFLELLRKNDPKDIVFYSLATGILRNNENRQDNPTKTYTYKNLSSSLTITSPKGHIIFFINRGSE